MLTHRILAVALGSLLIVPLVARADLTDTFTTDNGGWGHVGDATTPPDFHATGGNPGGYISISDLANGVGDYFVAPSRYLGTQSAAVNGTLSFDIMLSNAQEGSSDDVFLSDGTTNLSYLFSPALTAGSWIHETLTLNPTDPNWHLGSYLGAAPTQSDFQNVFGSLTTFQILADYHAGTETVGLDNVNLHYAPEPASLGFITLSILLAGRRRVR